MIWNSTVTLNWARAADLCKSCPWGSDFISLASAALSWDIESYRPEPYTDKIWAFLQHLQCHHPVFKVTKLFSFTVFWHSFKFDNYSKWNVSYFWMDNCGWLMKAIYLVYTLKKNAVQALLTQEHCTYKRFSIANMVNSVETHHVPYKRKYLISVMLNNIMLLINISSSPKRMVNQ